MEAKYIIYNTKTRGYFLEPWKGITYKRAEAHTYTHREAQEFSTAIKMSSVELIEVTVEEDDFYQTNLFKLLAKGLNQKEVSDELKRLGVNPSSHSSVEKKIKQYKKLYGANTLFDLALKVKAKGII